MRISDWSSDVCSSDLVEGPAIPPQAGSSKRHCNRCEQLERRVQGGDLEYDQEEADAILDRPNVTIVANAFSHLDGHVIHRVGTAKERHGAGGGIAEAVGQQMQEFGEAFGTDARTEQTRERVWTMV